MLLLVDDGGCADEVPGAATAAAGLRSLTLPQPTCPLPRPLFRHPRSVAQVESFAQGLQQHQLATLPDGSTVLERSVTEHNLEAASKLYSNIYVAELGALLGVPGDKAEAVAGRMVMEKRLQVGVGCWGGPGTELRHLTAGDSTWPPGRPLALFERLPQLLPPTTVCCPPSLPCLPSCPACRPSSTRWMGSSPSRHQQSRCSSGTATSRGCARLSTTSWMRQPPAASACPPASQQRREAA